MDTFEIFALCALPVLTVLLFLLERALRRERRRSYLLYIVSEKLKDTSFSISAEPHPNYYNYTENKLHAAVYNSYLDARKIIDNKKLK